MQNALHSVWFYNFQNLTIDVLERDNLFTFLTLFNKKLNMVYKGRPMTLHNITELYTEWSSIWPNITSKFRTITRI
jgi:hypothetical protein